MLRITNDSALVKGGEILAILNCDKFFIEELNKNGIDLTYKEVMSIYKDSRDNPDYLLRKSTKKSAIQLMSEALEMEKRGEKKHDSER